MSLVSSAIPNLVNGVSQQPYVQRLISQGEKQVNGYSSLVEGLRKRPPTVHLAKLANAPLPSAYIHTINRSATEQYTVIFDGTSLQVFAMDGSPRTVHFPNGTSYLTSASPQATFTATTVADFTFVINKNMTVSALSSDPVPTRPFEALIWFRSGNYRTTYSVAVNGRGVTLSTADSSNAINQAGIDTVYMCSVFTEGLVNPGSPSILGLPSESVAVSGTSLSGFSTVSQIGSTIYLASTTDFTASVFDGQGGIDIVLSKGVVQTFADLPAQAVNGVLMEIEGQGNDGTNSNYFVQYSALSGVPFGGVWNEVAKPGELRTLDPSTMPYQLVRNSDGTFTFEQATWAKRAAGALSVCPLPSFVGQTLNGVFFYQNRLGLLGGENVVMSRTASPFDFTRATALQLLDTDPIDIGSTSTQPSVLKAAVPFEGSLLLFSDLVQFQLGFTNILSPNTVSITPATAFFANLQASPVSAGSNVYFAFSRGSFLGIREYYLDGAGRVDDANDITSNVPSYIPGNPLRLTVATNESCLVALADGDQTSLWVYRYYWSQGSKLQSSWSQWQFAATDTILNAEFIQNNLYLVVSRADGVYLEFINIQPGELETGQDFLVHLDRKVTSSLVTHSYNSTTKLTTLTFPYAPADWTQVHVVAWTGDATYDVGRLVPVTSTGATTATVPGNLTQFFAGVTYEFRYRFSTFITHEPVPMTYSMQAVTEGRLQIRYALVNYANSGYFRAEVTPHARDMSTYVFTGLTFGDAGSKYGAPTISTGVFKFPVTCRNSYATIDIVNDSYLPCFLESAGWEGFFILRSQRTS